MISKIKNFLTLSFLIGIAGLATIIFTVTLIYPTLPDVESLSKYRPTEPLQIFTKDNYLIQEFGEERRDFIAIENVPQKMINAILAIEDRRFFEHPGIDFIGIIRAVVKNFTGQSREGASTITMQVARNFFLSSEKTLKRKFNEILLSLKIENKLTKEEILELYINQIYLGQRSFGFSAAANTYFNKSLENLNLAEIALLAGLPKAPSRYNPLSNPDLAIARQHTVLNNMYKYGFIDRPSYILALEEHLDLVEKNIKIGSVMIRATPIMETLTGFMIAGFIIFSGKLIATGELGVNNFFSFLAAMMLAYQPVRALATLNISIQQGISGAKRVLPIIDSIPEIKEKNYA